ncbi:MAG TPA: hypothetical protein VNN80_19175, partial [Polyangiaceae bacterium]|nr:hypothetical protein [Polyangiaceae bacterium]
MSYRSIFVFDNATNFGMDWSQLDFADDRPRRLGFFTRIDEPYSGPAPVGSWLGRENTLSVIRADDEHLTDLFSTANDPPSGGATGSITALLRNLAEDASHRLPALVNVFYRPEVLRFSYVFGRRAIGPGGMRGGLSSLPQSL